MIKSNDNVVTIADGYPINPSLKTRKFLKGDEEFVATRNPV